MMLSLHSKSCRVNCTSSISVMTYNIWNTNTFTKDDKQYPDRFKLLEKVLLDELPDIITFQEVRYEHLKGGYLGPSQMKHLSDILKSYQVHILTTHLSLSHEAREESVVQIWRYIKGLPGPVLLTGDFNAEPQEKAIRFLRGEVPLKGERTCGVSDLWTNVYPLSPGFTFDCVSGDLVKRVQGSI
uniref:Endonuclease/exonuclease/phosphatase domain-containing protein n=1 Tax=Magallana gigas TaxID=29159 RepID=K1PFF5_MAGGI